MLGALVSLLLRLDPGLQAALDAQAATPGARVEVLAWHGPACVGPFEASPVLGSGRVAVHVRGPTCEGWGWATVRVVVRAAVAQRSLRSGEALDGAWALQDVELRGHQRPLTEVVPGATATRPLRRGDVLWSEAVRWGPPPGAPIAIRVVSGGVTVEQRGVVAACGERSPCATLPNGRRVFGTLSAGALLVSVAGATP